MSLNMQKPVSDGPELIQIHEKVIVTIVRKVAAEVDGVSRIAGNSLVDNIAELVGSNRIKDRAISVQMGDGSVAVEVAINLLFGYKLPEVARALQDKIENEIQNLTGLKVSHVDIIIRDIDEPVEK
ncbi:MAG: Asp23/Gls24 family envelope stress response protein [Lentisphaeria bacterium]|nr:Asp23/Gls24 family envelope stress response protein [Lentisphaeria bacterium]